jgi:hypothetical protein
MVISDLESTDVGDSPRPESRRREMAFRCSPERAQQLPAPRRLLESESQQHQMGSWRGLGRRRIAQPVSDDNRLAMPFDVGLNTQSLTEPAERLIQQ